jgi:hypothetical protein
MSKFTRLRLPPAEELRWRELAGRIVAVPKAEIDYQGGGLNAAIVVLHLFGRLRSYLEDRERQSRIHRADARPGGHEAARRTGLGIRASLSTGIALVIGTVELLQVLAAELNLRGRLFNALAALNFESLGYSVVALFVVGWALPVVIWKFRRMEEHWRYVGLISVSVTRASGEASD